MQRPSFSFLLSVALPLAVLPGACFAAVDSRLVDIGPAALLVIGLAGLALIRRRQR
jgi:hypothetical protein